MGKKDNHVLQYTKSHLLQPLLLNKQKTECQSNFQNANLDDRCFFSAVDCISHVKVRLLSFQLFGIQFSSSWGVENLCDQEYENVERNTEATEVTVTPGQILYSTDYKVENAIPYFSHMSEVSWVRHG